MRLRPLLIGAMLLGALPLDAQVREERRWPITPNGEVKIHNYVGSVRVIGWDRDTIVATAMIPSGHRLYGGGGASAVKMGVEGPNGAKGESVAMEIRVPAGANVWVRGASTDIEVSGIIGTVDVGTVSGKVVVRGVPRALSAESMSGSVDVQASCESLRAKTSSGTLTWRGSAGEAQLSSVSGTVRVNGGPIERVRVETVTGAVHVTAGLRADAQLWIETHGGDVDLRFPARTPVRLDADAAEVMVPGVAPRTRPTDGRFTGATTYEFNLSKKPGTAPMVSVRSFTGRLAIGFP